MVPRLESYCSTGYNQGAKEMKKKQTREEFLADYTNWSEKDKRRRAQFAAKEAAKSAQALSDPFFIKHVYSHVYHGVASDFEDARGT